VNAIAQVKLRKGIKRMNVNVDGKLHDAFKAVTAAQGKNMTDVLLEFIEHYVKKHQLESLPQKGGKQ
jgi:ParG